jgi:hypothetical protein
MAREDKRNDSYSPLFCFDLLGYLGDGHPGGIVHSLRIGQRCAASSASSSTSITCRNLSCSYWRLGTWPGRPFVDRLGLGTRRSAGTASSISTMEHPSCMVRNCLFRARYAWICCPSGDCYFWPGDTGTLVLIPSPRLVGLAVGPWGEELGWRGYAQPQLQRRIGALGASLVVGTIWSVWHYWPVLTPAGGSLREFISPAFGTWLAYELANSVMMAWLYNSTGGSLPIAWAAHAGLSLGQNLVNKHPIPFGSFVLTFWVAAALVVIRYGAQNLSRRCHLSNQ